MVKRIKTIGTAVCLMAALVFVLFSCSKDKEETAYKKIAGTWYLANDPACRWTFDEFAYGCTSCYLAKLHINKLETYNALDCRYMITNNTLELHHIYDECSGERIVESYLSIGHIKKNSMHISGTIQLQYYDYYDGLWYPVGDAEEIEINYELKK